MNRTLLLILCDFLLLTLLALANWETAAPPATPLPASTADATEEGARTAAQDIVDVMQLSLADEQAARAELSGALDSTREELAARERALAEREALVARLAAERAALDTSLQATRLEAEAARRESGVTAERLAQLQRDLETREAEARRRAEEVIQLERAQAAATARIQQLDVAVQVAEQEKTLLRQTADAYRSQVEVEREERQRAQATTAQLATGVGELAQSSRAITQEIRDNRPINANTLYSEFVANRVPATFRLERSALLGPLTRATTPNTLLVTDGTDTVALLHIDDTPINLREPPPDWSTIEVNLSKNNHRSTVPRLDFLSTDPRIVALPVNAFQVSALGAKVYQTALDPFRFPEAVLIANNGSGYGEVPFKLDPANPAYVRMDNRLVRRLFGDYSPSRGDLVLSKTGELLGVMVSADTCALVTNFLPARTLPTGDTSATPTSPTLRDLATRVSRLPGGR